MKTLPKRILIGCEASGTVRREFAKYGHYVVSCDIRSSDDNVPAFGHFSFKSPLQPLDGWHHTGDIFEFLNQFQEGYFDLAIYHAPCTDILQNGVRWIYYGGVKAGGLNPENWQLLVDGAEFFKRLHEHPAAKNAVSENPKMSSYAQDIVGHPWRQHFQPYWFGHREKKDIYLWIRGDLPSLDNPIELYVGPAPKEGEPGYADWAIVHTRGVKKGVDRGIERSAFYSGIADQMALQWAGDAR